MDGTVAAFQAHGNHGAVAEIAARLTVATGRSADVIAQTLLNDRRAFLGITDMLVHLRGTGVQWNPADHLCMAGQVLCRSSPRWNVDAVWRDPRRRAKILSVMSSRKILPRSMGGISQVYTRAITVRTGSPWQSRITRRRGIRLLRSVTIFSAVRGAGTRLACSHASRGYYS